MVGMEDGPFNARRGIDTGDDSLFSEPPSLFLDDDDFDRHDRADHRVETDYYLDDPAPREESWAFDPLRADYEATDGELLPSIGLFDFDDSDDDIIVGGDAADEFDSFDLGDAGANGAISNNGLASGLGPSWTDERAAVPPVVVHPTPAVGTEWSDVSASSYAPPSFQGYDESYDDTSEDVEDEGTFKRSRRLNRILMVLTLLIVAGVVGAVYTYLNREQGTQVASEGSAEQTSDATDASQTSATSGNAAVLAGPDPVGILTNVGSFRIVTTTETDGAAAEYGSDSGLGTPTFLALTDTMAYVVNEAGTAWRINYREDPTPLSLVDLNKDKTEPPPATTIYHFASADDGTIFFTDVDGNLWQVDPTANAALVYSPQAPDSAVAQLAANPTTLFVRTIGGDVYRHERGGDGATLAYGPSNDNPEIISLAPTETGVILTAIGGIVRLVDPTQQEPLSEIYKPNGDKGVAALAAGSGAAVLTKAGNVIYSAAGSKNVPIYTTDGATKPPAGQIVALGNGTLGVVDADGNLWLLDITAENPTKLWDAGSLGAVSAVQPTQDAFAVNDAQGNVWSVPGTPGSSAQQLSASNDARSIATALFSLNPGSS